MNRAVSVCLSLLGKTDQDQGGSGRGGHHHHPQLAKEILVPSSAVGLLDPSPAPMQAGSPVTTPARQVRALPHRPVNPPVNSVAAEQRALQYKGFSESVIRTILAATYDIICNVYNDRWVSFVSWCIERGQNPIRMSVKRALDFLQLKSEVLAMNTMKGYVKAFLVQDASMSLDPSIKRWIKRLKHTKGIPHLIMPARCLEFVLAAVTRAPFEPIGTCRLKYLTWETAFLLAILNHGI